MLLPSTDFSVLSNDIRTSKIGLVVDKLLTSWWSFWLVQKHFDRFHCLYVHV